MKDLSLAARYEVTKKYAQAYAQAPKQGKSVILDQVVEVTGWRLSKFLCKRSVSWFSV